MFFDFGGEIGTFGFSYLPESLFPSVMSLRPFFTPSFAHFEGRGRAVSSSGRNGILIRLSSQFRLGRSFVNPRASIRMRPADFVNARYLNASGRCVKMVWNRIPLFPLRDSSFPPALGLSRSFNSRSRIIYIYIYMRERSFKRESRGIEDVSLFPRDKSGTLAAINARAEQRNGLDRVA